MAKIDYLKDGGDFHKYDNVESALLWGSHPEHPKFTITIPTYKRHEFLTKSLYSALNQQNYTDYEIVISDNDAEEEQVKENLELVRKLNSDKIVYYKNEKNIGIYGNTLRAAQLAHGRYVVLLDDDDLLHPRYLEIVNAFIEKYHYKGIVGSQPHNFRKGDFVFPETDGKVYAFQVSKVEFFFGCCVTSPGLCYPKKIMESIYNAHEELLMGDQIIQYKSVRKYGLTFINFPIAAYRIADNVTLENEVMTDMTINMCGFRKQTAGEDWKLKIFMKIFEKEYFYCYIDSFLNYWKKKGLEANILKKLKLDKIERWSFKTVLYNDLVDRLHAWYTKRHAQIQDYIEIEP